MTMVTRISMVCVGGALLLSAASMKVMTQAPQRAQLLLVADGLRPDYVTPELMPRLYALAQRGVRFDAHHSVFPTVTRVNSSSISTGAYPESHGLMGNSVYSEKTFPTKGVSTFSYEELEAMEKAEGHLLTAPTLGESLQRAGKKFLVISAGSSGSALLLNHPVSNGAVINVEFVQPASLQAEVDRAVGKAPAEAIPNNARNTWAVDVYLSLGLTALKSEVTAIWFGDPDATAHQKGIGSDTTRQALRFLDGEIGRIEDTLRTRGLLDSTNIILTSDHGFSTHTGELKLAALVAPFARPLPDGTPDLVVTEGAINFRGAKDAARVGTIVAALQKRPEVGAIFTRPASAGSLQGVIPGTLSFNVARWNHARASEIMISGNWSHEKNEAGAAGKTSQEGVAGHGTSSPYDIHATLIAVGPDFRDHAVNTAPTANVDIAPTLLRLLSLPIPASMTGRPFDEALRSGPALTSVRVATTIETAKTADGSYQVDAHLSTVAGKRYLDYTEVRRTAR